MLTYVQARIKALEAELAEKETAYTDLYCRMLTYADLLTHV